MKYWHSENLKMHLNRRQFKISYVIGMMQNKSSKVAAAAFAAALSVGATVGIAGASTNQAHRAEFTGLKRPEVDKNATTTISIYLRKGGGVSGSEFSVLKNAVLLLYNGNTEKVRLKNGEVTVKNIGLGNPHGGYDISLWGINKSNPFAQTPLNGASPAWWYSMHISVRGPGISVLHQVLRQYPASSPWIIVRSAAKNQSVYLVVSKATAAKTSASAGASGATTTTTTVQSTPATQ